ncbi:WD40-repeat-containing domain protein [Sporodiniella umbellata]|nr:WD40-repeat-containing domain protein [Sporodiniella umbellata]
MEEDQKSFQELKTKWAQREGEQGPPPIPPKPTGFSVSSSNSSTATIPIVDIQHNNEEPLSCKSSLSPPKYDPFSESSEDDEDEEAQDDVDAEGLIQQVQKAHLQYTKLEESRSPKVQAQIIQDKNTRRPPPPPPPSRKYHSSVRAGPNQVPMPPPQVPFLHPIKPDASPPLLPPRPPMPQLPPRPSQSTLARAHTIASQPDGERNHPLQRANTTTTPKRAMSRSELFMTRSVYPDFSQASRNPPCLFEHDHRLFSTSHKGSLGALLATRKMVITGTHSLKTWDIHTGMPLTTLVESGAMVHVSGNGNANEMGDKVRAVVFAPTRTPQNEGQLWVARQESGLSIVDVFSGKVIGKRPEAHQAPIAFLLRYRNAEIWSIDESGLLNVWDPNLSQPRPQIVTAHATACTLNGTQLWMSTGRTLAAHAIAPPLEKTKPPIRIPNDLGNITRLITIPFHSGMIFASHDDGKISVWDGETLERLQVITVSLYGICTMACVGEYYVWAGYNTGMIYVYDTRPENWSVVKVWKAHTGAVTQLIVDESELLWDENRGKLQVLSSDSNGFVGLWDGLLTEHWKGNSLHRNRTLTLDRYTTLTTCF